MTHPQPDPGPVLVIHGGAGVKPRGEMTQALKLQFEEDLKKALREGQKALDHMERVVLLA